MKDVVEPAATRLLAEVAAAVVAAAERRGPEAPAQLAGTVAVLAAEHRTDSLAGRPDPRRDPVLARMRVVFGLDESDVGLLVAAAGPDLDANLGLAYALLQGDLARQRLTVGLALELTGSGALDAAARARLTGGSPLLRHGLLEVLSDLPFLARPLRVPDRVVAHLLGDDTVDPVVRRCLTQTVPLHSPAADVLARALERGAPLAWVREPPGGAGLALAAGAIDSLAVRHLAVDAQRIPAPMGPVLAAAAREAGLLGAGLIVAGADRLAEEPALLTLLEEAAVPVIACARRSWDPAWPATLPVTVDAGALEPEEREQLWHVALQGIARSEDDAAGWRDLMTLRVTPEEIVRLTRAASDEAGAQDAVLSVADVRTAARRLAGGGVTGAAAVRARAGFADLVLPPDTLASLHELADWARHRDAVLSQGPVAGAGGKGRGIAALFAGGPGTGKTLAAQVVAGALGLDLQTVDLSSVVDKYIGETEKNLEKVFREAETLNVVLFFDEADALFGSRSEVKDSRDRYANQEVAYLLQRMEAFNGIAVLASNLRGNLDAAFSRRLHFIVHFPDPDAATRLRLWERHLAALSGLDESDPIDLQRLADKAELSGGDIRNIVLAAAYAAAAQGTLVGARLLGRATEREYRKLGRRIPERGFG